jgi:hypothetical protein
VASQVIGWLEILYYIGNRKEIEEWTSVPIGSPWDRMKPLCCHAPTEQTNRRQEQEFMMALKRGCFAGLGKSVRVCWAGNRCVRERGQVSELEECGGGGRSRGSERKLGQQSGGW